MRWKNYCECITGRDIGLRINATVGSIDNMITRLVKLVKVEILIRIDRGMYVVNDELEGLSFKVDEMIEMTITYNDGTKNIRISGGKK